MNKVINNEDITLALKDVNDKITQVVDFFMVSLYNNNMPLSS